MIEERICIVDMLIRIKDVVMNINERLFGGSERGREGDGSEQRV